MVYVNHTRRDISFTSAVKFGVETCVENFIRIEFKTRFVSPAPISSPAPVFGTKLRSGCSLAGGDPAAAEPAAAGGQAAAGLYAGGPAGGPGRHAGPPARVLSDEPGGPDRLGRGLGREQQTPAGR